MADYRVFSRVGPPPFGGVVRLRDGAFVPEDEGNADWREYQEWLALGNIPDPEVLAAAARRTS